MSGRRLIAHFVDGVIYTLIFVVLLLLAGATSDLLLTIVIVLGLTVLHVAYFVVLQRRDGRSPGKRVVGLRVVDAAGQVPTTAALVKRTVPLLIEYLYVIAFVGMMSSSYRQRFGDRWGRTYVVAD